MALTVIVINCLICYILQFNENSTALFLICTKSQMYVVICVPLSKCLNPFSLGRCSDVDATMLACIAFSCPNLEFMEISSSDTALNRITGYNLCSLLLLYFLTHSQAPGSALLLVPGLPTVIACLN